MPKKQLKLPPQPDRELKQKPLVEAIWELRWNSASAQSGPVPVPLPAMVPGSFTADPHGHLLLSRLYDRMIDTYPEFEQLPSASLPDVFVGQVPQHRFRKAHNAWPLVQLGPGILTYNSTDDYKWENFYPSVLQLVNSFFEAHPKPTALKFSSMTLRYIDAIAIELDKTDVFQFLKDKLKLNVSFPGSLFDKTIDRHPKTFNWTTSFSISNPSGLLTVNFALGEKDDVPSLIWETIVQSFSEDIPVLPSHLAIWLESAHKICNDWFFHLIEGELRRKFSGE